MKTLLATLTLATLSPIAALAADSTAKVVDLRCESQTNPEEVNTPIPSFSWRVETDQGGFIQRSYHLLVASSADRLSKDEGDLWDSGVRSIRSSQFVRFGGSTLRSGQEAHWKVRVQDLKNKETSWSEPAKFTVKLSGPAPLPDPLFPASSVRLSSFETSAPSLNKIYSAAAASLPKITKPRDVGLAIRGAAYHTPILPRLQVWLNHFNASANDAGFFPAILPADGTFGSTSSDAGIACIHAEWWMTGDTSILMKHWPTMIAYSEARRQVDQGYNGTPFGEFPPDTLPAGDPTPPAFVHLTSHALSLRLILEMAKPGSTNPYDIRRIQADMKLLQDSFRSAYLREDNSLKYDSITAHLLALRSGVLANDAQKDALKSGLLALLEQQANAGTSPVAESPLAAQVLLPVLTWSDQFPRAVELARNLDPEKLSPTALVTISEWLISMVAGIDTANPGFLTARLQPHIPPKEALSYAKAHYDSPYGRIATHWHYQGDDLIFDVAIPPNMTARIKLPVKQGQSITEGGKPLNSWSNFAEFEQGGSFISFHALPGNYSFKISAN